MRSIPAFSKEKSNGPTVGGGGQRSGFTPHVKATKLNNPTSLKGLAGFSKASTVKNSGGSSKAHPSFKGRSSSGAGKSVPAFSKKKI